MLIKVVRYINVSIAVLVVLAAAAVYWLAIRPLPKVTGQLSAPIQKDALIKRDAIGVAHIKAQTQSDAYFLQGFATAQDRLWQIDTLRRYAKGELAEVFGRAALKADERARRMRIGALAQIAAQHLSDDDRRVFESYAAGINAFIDQQKGNYQLEFNLPGHAYAPKHWAVADSIAVGLVMFRNMTDTIDSDFDRLALQLIAADKPRLQALFPPVAGGPLPAGSNNWTVSGAHTASGASMLANDTHLDYGIPPTWHMVHLKAPGLHVTGFALPGVPGIIIGHNEQIAWGVTNLGADVMDLYAEELNPQTGQYLFEGHVEQAQLDLETINVLGEKPVMVKIWVTCHGPIVLTAGRNSFAMRWSASDGFGYPFRQLAQAADWQQFRTALSNFWGPGQNFVYADKAGNIGYQAAGKVPIRNGFHGNAPLVGSSGAAEWSGYIPFDAMPSVYNPPSGIIATANQNPFSGDQHIDGSYADIYRVQQIRARLNSTTKLTEADMLAIAKDVYSAYDKFLAEQVLASVRGWSDQAERDALDQLRHWNGQMDKDSAAPLITQLVSAKMTRALLLSTLPPAVRPKFIPPMLPRPSVVERLLRERPAGWVPNNDWSAWIAEQFRDALIEGRRLQGSPVSNWRWGKTLTWNFQHPVGKQLPLVSAFFDIGPVPMSGSETTVKQTTLTKGPSERIVVQFGNLDKSLADVTTGESGHVASRHYKDQWPSYYVGKSFPMQFQYVDAPQILHVSPETRLK